MSDKTNDLPFRKEYGWWHIVTDEDRARFAPKRPTDQFFLRAGSKWCDVMERDERFRRLEFYRRRVDPGDGWELVQSGSDAELDDEWWDEATRSWLPLRGHKADCSVAARRRTLKSLHDDLVKMEKAYQSWQASGETPAPQRGAWVPVAERLPDKFIYYWCSYDGEVIGQARRNCHTSMIGYWILVNGANTKVTHWFDPSPLPDPPHPPEANVREDEKERAWNVFWSNIYGAEIGVTRAAFDAGWQAACDSKHITIKL